LKGYKPQFTNFFFDLGEAEILVLSVTMRIMFPLPFSVINVIKFNINILTSKGIKTMQIYKIDKPAPDISVPTSLKHMNYFT